MPVSAPTLATLLCAPSLALAKTLGAYGYQWQVRDTGGGKAGPGPNIFSSSNVNLNADGTLRFGLSKSDGEWHCSEATLLQELGYGDYDFTLEQDVSALADADPHVVLGFFLYKDDTHELDIEFARWGDASTGANNADYVNQPGGSGKTLLWKQPSLQNTVHRIRYRPGRVDWYSSQQGSSPFQTFTSTADVPATDGMLLHINFWMFQGKSSWTGSNVDVTLTDFKFTPYAGPAAPIYEPHGCKSQSACYIFDTRDSALSACKVAGHDRLCNVEEATGHALCKGGWFADGEGYWMGQASAGCGHAGFNEFGGTAGAYCCSATLQTLPAIVA